MFVKRVVSILVLAGLSLTAVSAAKQTDDEIPFSIFPEVTELGEFLCKLTFWRGLPPCFDETVLHGSFAYYPTREKAKIIVDSFLIQGLYSQDLLVSFFGTLMTGAYRPVPSIPVGNYWDAGYFGLVKLDKRIEAKRLLMDVILDQGWAKGKFINERYKALDIISKERLVTLREYKPLKDYLTTELAKESPDYNWVNSLILALSSFREWSDELLPIYRDALTKLKPGIYKTILKAFLDFDVPDDAEFIASEAFNSEKMNTKDRELSIRTAYVLDSELIEKQIKEYLEKNKDNTEIDPEFKTYLINTLERLKWYGYWEITDTHETSDPGLLKEKLAFRMKKSLDESKDIANFSMSMQISWDPGQLLPIGLEETYETNYVSYLVTPTELIYTITNPYEHTSVEKPFTIRVGKGRNEGRFYLQFVIPGETDKKGNPKLGWIEIEKISS